MRTSLDSCNNNLFYTILLLSSEHIETILQTSTFYVARELHRAKSLWPRDYKHHYSLANCSHTAHPDFPKTTNTTHSVPLRPIKPPQAPVQSQAQTIRGVPPPPLTGSYTS